MKLAKYLLAPAIVPVLLACACDAQTGADLKIHSGEKIAFLGDSITQFGWDRPGGYVHLVIAGLDSVGVKAIPIPAGVSGNTSRDMIARVDRDVISKKPDWMTLSCGVNDVWHGANGVDLDNYKKNITEIVDKAQAAGIKVMILTATVIQEVDNPLNQKLAAYNDFLRELAKEKNLPLVDLNADFWKALKPSATGAPTVHLTVDGVHMNPEGNMLMARGILEGFGLSSGEVDKYETAWRSSPDAACVVANVGLNLSAGVSLDAYNAVGKIAAGKKESVNQMQFDLAFAALRTVLKAHEQDTTLTYQQIQPEVNREFASELDALVKSEK